MARGDMAVTTEAIGTGAEILNRPPYKAVSMTLDFTSVVATDALGRKVVKAGTPIDGVGVAVDETPWTGASGILLFDVTEDRPQGAILTEGYVNKARAEANSGLTYDAALTTAMVAAGNRIRFE